MGITREAELWSIKLSKLGIIGPPCKRTPLSSPKDVINASSLPISLRGWQKN